MTLGGLALAVGILVDDATVEIENIHRNLGDGQADDPGDPRRRAADRGAGVRLDALRSASCSCRCSSSPASRGTCSCRWPMAVVFAMLASYLLSRTLVPTMVRYLLRGARRSRAREAGADAQPARAASAPVRARFERLRERYRGAARRRARASARVLLLAAFAFCVVVAARARAVRSARTSSRPSTPARSGCTCARRPGTRIEETARALRPGRSSRSAAMIPPTRSTTILDNIGLPNSGINLIVQQRRRRSARRRRDPRRRSTPDARARPRTTSASCGPTLAARVSRHDVLLPAGRHRRPDPQLRPAGADRRAGRRRGHRREPARSPPNCCRSSAAVPGDRRRAHPAAVATGQTLDDRRRPDQGEQVGLTQRDVATNLLHVAERQLADHAELLARTRRTASATRSSIQTPQYRIDSLDDAAQHADHDSPVGRVRSSSATSADRARRRARRSSSTTTSSR